MGCSGSARAYAGFGAAGCGHFLDRRHCSGGDVLLVTAGHGTRGDSRYWALPTIIRILQDDKPHVVNTRRPSFASHRRQGRRRREFARGRLLRRRSRRATVSQRHIPPTCPQTACAPGSFRPPCRPCAARTLGGGVSASRSIPHVEWEVRASPAARGATETRTWSSAGAQSRTEAVLPVAPVSLLRPWWISSTSRTVENQAC